ncbi:MAG: efflux transporter periplasmic adaptor subunit, partial [Stenotrophomonas indicatrix]
QGLQAGQRIVVDGTGKLRAGLKVAASDAAPASGAQPATVEAPTAAEGHGG